MQQCWAIIEYDMALWKKMNVDNVSAYAMDVFVVCCWYCGAIIGYFVGTIAVINLGKKTIYVRIRFSLIYMGPEGVMGSLSSTSSDGLNSCLIKKVFVFSVNRRISTNCQR